MSGRVLRLRRISRNVADLTRMVAFYCEALDFRLIGRRRIEDPGLGALLDLPGVRAQVARLCLGAQEIELVAFDPPGRPYPHQGNAADLGFQHLAIVVSDMSRAHARILAHGVAPISVGGPQTLPPNTGSVVAFKFRDPEGHPLELIHFPPGVGAPCWQQAQGLFQGIDHSAIAVADTDASVAFYERLGWHVAGRSRNQGPAQDRLDGLAGVDVDVVGLETYEDGPPHLELLGYREPHPQPLRSSPAANDVVADRLVLDVDDLPALQARLGVREQMAICAGGTVAMLLRDPSGHRLVLQEEPMVQEG